MNLKIKATLVAAFCIVGGIGQSQTMDIFQSLELDDPAALAIVINQTSDLEAQNVQGDTAVITAARLGNLVAIEALVNAGADINALDRNKRDILNIAITTQNIDLARHALSLGADPTLVTSVYDGGAIIYGSAKGAVEIVEMLIAAGAPVNRVNNLGWTALLEVAILGDGSQPYVEIAQMLVGAGADLNIKDRNGLTAFDHATSKGHLALAEVLSSG